MAAKAKGYSSEPLSAARKMVIASIAANKRTAIHSLTEIDVSRAREQIREHAEQYGEKISFTAFLVHSLAACLKEFPGMNSFIRGRRLIQLEDITISVMVERELGGEKVPEPLAIRAAQDLGLMEIHQQIRAAQSNKAQQLGTLGGSSWIRHIPSFLFRLFVRLADRNIRMAKRYGKVAITSVGMYSPGATWFIPHGTATILLTVGSISPKQVWTGEAYENRYILHLTLSFDHEIIDGSPAARFLSRLTQIMGEGIVLGQG